MKSSDMTTPLNILYLEDSPLDAELVREALVDAGFMANFDLATTKDEYASFLHGSRKYDIILSDFKLIGFNAFEALELATNICPNVPFICISGTIGEETAVELMKRGAIDYVFKDKITKLPVAINRAIQETTEREARRKAEDALRRNEERLREAQAIGRIGNWEYDILHQNIIWSDEMYVLLERAPELGPPSYLKDAQNYSSEQEKKLLGNVLEVIETGKEFSCDIESKLPSGRPAFFHVIVQASTDSENKVTGLFGTIQDITARKLSEIDLLQSEKKYRDLVDNLNEGIWLADQNGITTFVNPKMAEMIGYTMAEIIGKPQSRFIANEEQIIVSEETEETEETEEQESSVRKQCTLEFIKKDGSKMPALIVRSPIIDESGNLSGFLSGIIDISEQAKLEKEKNRIQDQLFQFQKMDAIGRLAGGVAHDFNNILTVIIGLADLERLAPQNERSLLFVTQILEAANRARDVTMQLLAFSRKQVLQPRMLDVNAHLEGLQSFLGRLVTENIQVNTIYEPAIGFVKVDPTQLTQIIMNLMLNARDAMPDGGTLTLATETTTLDPQNFPSPGDAIQGQFIQISISDTGCGMSKNTLDHLFEPFFTTKEVNKGTGLGLSMIYGIVQQSGGHVSVQSEVGQGTTFRIYFPCVEGAIDPVLSPPSDAKGHGQETILIVEDDPGIRKMMRIALEAEKYQVFQAESLSNALLVARSQTIDLLVTDVILPEMNGPQVAEEIQKLHPELKVLYMSGYTQDVIGDHGILDPNINFLQKPFNLRALLTKIRGILDQPALST